VNPDRVFSFLKFTRTSSCAPKMPEEGAVRCEDLRHVLGGPECQPISSAAVDDEAPGGSIGRNLRANWDCAQSEQPLERIALLD